MQLIRNVEKFIVNPSLEGVKIVVIRKRSAQVFSLQKIEVLRKNLSE